MAAYYNEFDPKAAAWLRELIKQGLIAPGEVDERSINDVEPVDLLGYTQCHFFAGIGGWSYALRLAGWSDDNPVWTGSCPCQPFSTAGKQKGFDDERHLWPRFAYLIESGQPAIVFGEQVASKPGRAWLDTVRAQMEALGYAFGAADLCAAGVGAPHIRQRLWFVGERLGHTYSTGSSTRERHTLAGTRRRKKGGAAMQPGRPLGGVAHPASDRQPGESPSAEAQKGHAPRPEPTGQLSGRPERLGSSDRVADPELHRENLLSRDHEEAPGVPSPERQPENRTGLFERGGENDDRSRVHGVDGLPGETRPAGPTNGFWRGADWLGCRDGKFRPVEPGSFPLANGLPARVGRLRGYGNAIVPQVAELFIRSYSEAAL